MSCPFGTEELSKLKTFITFCSAKPEILNLPQLVFFKDFVEKLGGKVPLGEFKIPTKEEAAEKPEEDKHVPEAEDESEPESDVELDMTGVIAGDTDDPQPMGDSNKTATDEEMDEASEIRAKAAVAYSEQKYQEAIDLYTNAIQVNPGNALFHAKRGQAYLKLQKPNACIRDCDRALELNCDSAAAYKFRGRAYRLLGNFEAAAKDLRQACKLDFDEEADEWLKEVTPNAKKIEQHKIKVERKKAERELRKRQERLRKAQEANKKASEQQQQQQSANATPGSGAGAGGMPNLGNFFGNLNQSELFSAFNDPEVAGAMQDIMANPANIAKYQSNPKVMNLITKIGSAMGGPGGGGGGGFPGAGAGFPGAAPGFPGAAPGFPGAGFPSGQEEPKPQAQPKPDFTDDGLD